jgi:tetratricopeptide (TPR) repeat protein
MSAVSAMERGSVPAPILQQYRTQAYETARAEALKGSNNPYAWVVLAKLSLEDQNDAEFRQAATTLARRFPNQKETHYFNGIKAIQDKDWKTAEKQLRKAQEMGIPSDDIAAWLKMAIDNQKIIWEYACYTFYMLTAWIAGLVLLFFVGKVLSSATLRSIERRKLEEVPGSQWLLRRTYRLIVNLAGIYYYVSLPIVVLLAVALPLSIGYALLMLPVLNIYLVVVVLFLGVGGVVTALTGIRACFVRMREESSGRSISPEEAPDLWKLAREVGNRVGTREVDEIWLSPATDLSVVERGSYWTRFRDRGRRVMILGTALFEGLPQGSLRAMLAHEYAHFHHRDTAGGDIALRVNLAMANFADAVVERRRIRWWDAAFQFLRFYHFLFRRLTFGASRLQEVHSDLVAARAYGPTVMKEGLKHVVRRCVEFDQCMRQRLSDAVCGVTRSSDFYYPSVRLGIEDREEIETIIHELFDRPSSEADTHPSPRERFILLDRVMPEDLIAPDDGPVWGLFANREPLLQEMNDVLSQLIDAQARAVREMNQLILRHLNGLLVRYPEPAGYEERAALYARQGEYSAALTDLNRALEHDAASPSARFYRALVHKKMGDYESAVDDLEFLLKEYREARGFEVNYVLATCYVQLQRLDEAIEAFSLALAHHGASLGVLIGRAQAYIGQGRHDEAVGDLNAAIEKFPDCADAYCERGFANQALGRYSLARADYDRAVALDPHFTEARLRIAWLLSTCPENAHRDGSQALQHAQAAGRPPEANGWRYFDVLAAAHAEVGDYGSAAELADQAIQIAPPDHQHVYRWRRELYRNGEPYRETRATADRPETM